MESIREFLGGLNPFAHLVPDMDDALIGIAWRFGQPQVACYDYNACLKVLMDKGMDSKAAERHLMWNIMAHRPEEVEMPDQMPIYLANLRDEDESR